MSGVEVFGETLNQPGDSDPLQPRSGALWLMTFRKTKITFEREEISDHQWDSGKYNRAADGNWENCVWFQGAYFEGDWSIMGLCTMFLVSSSINVSYFSHYMAGYLLDRPHIYHFPEKLCITALQLVIFGFIKFYIKQFLKNFKYIYSWRIFYINWSFVCI